MSKVIWKHKLEISDSQIIEVPEFSEMLFVGVQSEIPYIWFRCNPELALVKKSIKICGTGHPAPFEQYIGSFMLKNGSLVFHVFHGDPLVGFFNFLGN